ncbi:Hippocampus abundant transcript 1 protein [Phytophthora cinnamomi]|uniref:Hippocampus abundant transcript 1 protein n=1 Tax=Phytophthora cinnamomi TaxID=4785 RepID=UPI003559BA61|nr:Hippocampus abundant transcript 1 protein [Phytophthora cinnamomi]
MEYRVRKRDVSGAGRLPRSLEAALPDAAVRRFLLRAGFRSSSDRAAAEVRRHVGDFFRRLVGCMLVMMQHDGRRSFRLVDVQRACEHFGIRMYGYDDLCLLAAGRAGGPEAFHVTELVECNSLFSRPVDAPEEPDTEPGARFKKTDFVANYASWRSEVGDADGDMSDASEWAFSDDDSDSEDGHDVDMDTPQLDEDRFLASLQVAQELVDEKLLQQPEEEDTDGENQPGQGYYSDYDDCYEPEYLEKLREQEEDEDAKWNKVGQLHVLQSDEDSDPAELQEFDTSPNLYVISRQEFLRLYRALLSLTLRMGELQISSVALSALHNATEQCLHRSLTEGSLHYQLAAILKEQEHANSTTQLESELQMQREKQQIEQLKKQLQGQHGVQMETSPSLKKKSQGKRKATIGALRSRGLNNSGSKKLKVTLM